MSRPPLEDRNYTPKHPPVDGYIPAVVEKWGPRSQVRWFDRFMSELRPQKPDVWERYYCSSEEHKGSCCSSCIQDRDEGYFDLYPKCCCRSDLEDTE